MRRKDREITHIHAILDLVSECRVCRLAMTDGGVPYIVPLNYGYEYADGALTFYFHSAKEGRKLEILKKNPMVCLELDGRGELVEDANPLRLWLHLRQRHRHRQGGVHRGYGRKNIRPEQDNEASGGHRGALHRRYGGRRMPV